LGGDMNFYNANNVAAFAENNFLRIGNRLSITPGLRFEYLNTVADGYDENDWLATMSRMCMRI
jgi:Fe(3+) dicitrate transport protein